MDKHYRVGNGYDIHRLIENRKLILGGIELPFHLGLLGHSDADVLTHSIMDAMLGALSLGDIGKYFPPSDQQFKNINSLELLKKVFELIKSEGYKVNNIDTVIQAEAPKILKYSETMKENFSKILEINSNQISIKATTMEGLGPIGEGKAIAAHAVALLCKI